MTRFFLKNWSLFSVKEVLKGKHPLGQLADPDFLTDVEAPPIHDVIDEPIDAALIRSAALKTPGAAEASGIDAYGWRWLCTSFNSASRNLCQALADMTKRLHCMFSVC